MNAIVINSLDEALQYVTDEKTDWSAVSVASSLFSFEIKIVGNGYDSSINGSFAKGLVALQSAVYRSYAASKRVEVRNLTSQEREQLLIWIKIGPGCSLLETNLKGLGELLKESFKGMDPKLKVILILGVAAVASGTWCYITNNNNEKEVRLAEVKNNAEAVRHEASMKVLSDSIKTNALAMEVLSKTSDNFKQASDELVSQAGPAKRISVGNRHYNEQEINTIQSPADRIYGSWLPNETVEVRVLSLDRSEPGILSFRVYEWKSNESYLLSMKLAGDSPDPMLIDTLLQEDGEILNVLCHALNTQELISIQIAKHVKGDTVDRVQFLGLEQVKKD